MPRKQVVGAEKTCTECGETKPETEFYKVANGVERRARCKKCLVAGCVARQQDPKWRAAKARERKRLKEVVRPLVASKTCSRCKEEKPASEFYLEPLSKDGLHTWCKKCCASKSREYSSVPENRERQRKKNIEWRKKNPDKVRAFETNRRVVKWANMLVRATRSSTANRQRDVLAGKRKDHGPERNVATTTEEEILSLFEEQKGLCYWFGIPMTPSAENRDPQRPSLDRLDVTKGYTRENVVLSCMAANLARNSASPEQFRSFVDLLFSHPR